MPSQLRRLGKPSSKPPQSAERASLCSGFVGGFVESWVHPFFDALLGRYVRLLADVDKAFTNGSTSEFAGSGATDQAALRGAEKLVHNAG